MKHPILLGVMSLALVAFTATTLYAQATGGGSIVDRMKAAAHAFTLTSDLNAGQTGLTSSPVAGKKTGDILTAAEWNRMLEIVSTGGGGSGWVDVPLSDTNPFDQQCMYRFVTQGQTYYAETVHENRIFWIYNMYFDKADKSALVGGIAPYNVATKIEKFCGGGSTVVSTSSPGTAKAWVTYRNIGGTVSTVGNSLGVQSVTSASGVTNFFNYDTIITLNEPLLATNYAVIASPSFNSGSGYYNGSVLDWVCIWSKVSSTSLGVHCAYPGYGAYGNSIVSVTVFSM